MIGNVDPIYWKMALGCFLIALLFLFITTDGLVKGKFTLPAWVFSSFTMVIGVVLFRVFLNSVNEFEAGQHTSLDQMIDMWAKVLHFVTHV
jgi:hypothetical protein